MIFHTSTYNDIVRYYSENIVKFQETEDRLWQIISIGKKEVKCVDADGFYLSIDLEEPYEVDYPLPGRVIYQDGAHAVMLSRKPAKQYNRGIHSDNTSLQYLDKNLEWRQHGFTIQKLQQFVDKPAYQDVNNIDWDSGYTSWALSKHFALSKAGVLFCLFKPIGKVVSHSKEVYLDYSLFAPEVKALFKGWKLV